jgi:hypothetical protein
LTNLKLLSLYLPGGESGKWQIPPGSDSKSSGPNLKAVQTTNHMANIQNHSRKPISWPKSETSLDSQSPGQNLKAEITKYEAGMLLIWRHHPKLNEVTLQDIHN